jgi:FkbM family methyltransferase
MSIPITQLTRRQVTHPIRNWAKSLIRKIGYDLKRYSPSNDDLHRLVHFCESFGTKLVLDVGANMGQFALFCRSAGFRETIISFEPQSSAHDVLRKFAAADDKWIIADRAAVGSRSDEIEINVSRNSGSSSILKMCDRHVRGDPNSVYVSAESAKMTTLDSYYALHREFAWTNCALKIDTQGYEMEVLAGAVDVLRETAIVFLEMSLAELYEGQAGFIELFRFLEQQGFHCVSLTPGFTDSCTFEILQVDGMFLRRPRELRS